MRLKRIVVKEVKELLREKTVLLGMILGPIFIFALFAGLSLTAGKQAVQQAAYTRDIAIMYNGTKYLGEARILAESIGTSLYTGPLEVEEAFSRYRGLVYIDDSFFRNISSGIPGRILVYARLDSLNLLSVSLPNQVEMAVRSGVYRLISLKVNSTLPGVTEAFLMNPIYSETMIYYKGKMMTLSEAFNLVFGVSMTVTMATLVLVLASMQVAATSIGIEREAKTLEMLLSLPVSRRELILGKVVGVSLITLLGVASYALGILIYFKSITSMVEQVPQQDEAVNIGFGRLEINTYMIPLFILSLIITLTTSLLIGLIVGSIPQDVRGAQLASSYIGLLLLAPVFGVFFGLDLTSLSGALKLLYLDPIILLYVVIWGVVSGDYTFILTGLAGQVVHLAVWILIASRVIESESILLGGFLMKVQRVFRRSSLLSS
ncbi:MAG: ABC transporter permease subunit [Desulfurococcales archaeon]|nr:ABC transporter permease subunit [Desulfurococcales archaeon]